MSENKLSREGLLLLLEEWFKYSHIGSSGQFTKCKSYEKCEKAKEQIKSLLTPIPEDRLDEFVVLFVMHLPVIPITGVDKARQYVKKMLKEYDELKETL